MFGLVSSIEIFMYIHMHACTYTLRIVFCKYFQLAWIFPFSLFSAVLCIIFREFVLHYVDVQPLKCIKVCTWVHSAPEWPGVVAAVWNSRVQIPRGWKTFRFLRYIQCCCNLPYVICVVNVAKNLVLISSQQCCFGFRHRKRCLFSSWGEWRAGWPDWANFRLLGCFWKLK
jgi:hypothetical protein